MPIYHIYCDESSTTNGRYMVIGGIIFPHNYDTSIKQGITDKMLSMGLKHEVSWDSISKSNVERYIELFKYFHSLVTSKKICFKAIVVDKTQYNKKKHDNLKDKPFYKMYFQLLYHKFCKLWYKANNKSSFVIFPDEKSSNIRLLDLKNYLNRTIRTYLGSGEVVLEITPRISEECPIIQIIDLYIGCMAYFKNGLHNLPQASLNKLQFIHAIQNHLHTHDFLCNNKL